MDKIRIDLGKGVVLSAPIKLRMTVDEWRRMSAHINGIVKEDTLRRK